MNKMEAFKNWVKDNDNCANWECENTWKAALNWALSNEGGELDWDKIEAEIGDD